MVKFSLNKKPLKSPIFTTTPRIAGMSKGGYLPPFVYAFVLNYITT